MKSYNKPATQGILLLFMILFFIAAGTVVYYNLEGLSWLDAVFFSVVTATTVGYGNIVPLTAAGKIFTIFYILLSILIVFTFINHFSRRTQQTGLFRRFFSKADNNKEE